MVRCRSCGSDQSEWAKSCSQCGADLADAVAIPERDRRSGVRRLAPGAIIVAVALVVGVAVAGTGGGRRSSATSTVAAPTGTPSSAQPAVSGQATTLPIVVWAVDPSGALVEHDPGEAVVRATKVAAWPEGPVRVGAQILYLSGGDMYQLGSQARSTTAVGVHHLHGMVPVAGGSQVWISAGAGAAFLFDLSQLRATSIVPMPGGETPVAAFPGTVVTLTPGGALTERDAISGAVLHTFEAGVADGEELTGVVLGATPQVLAFVACGDGPDCPLVVVTSSGDRVVDPPPSTDRFIPGGAISSHGVVAAFVTVTGSAGNAAELVLVDPATGRRQLLGAVIHLGDAVGAAAWTPDGRWLVFGGPTETFAYNADTERVIQLSYAAGYGFIAGVCC